MGCLLEGDACNRNRSTYKNIGVQWKMLIGKFALSGTRALNQIFLVLCKLYLSLNSCLRVFQREVLEFELNIMFY